MQQEEKNVGKYQAGVQDTAPCVSSPGPICTQRCTSPWTTTIWVRNLQDALSGGPKVIKAGFTNWLVQVQTISAENVWGLLEEFLVHHKFQSLSICPKSNDRHPSNPQRYFSTFSAELLLTNSISTICLSIYLSYWFEIIHLCVKLSQTRPLMLQEQR